MRRIDAASNQLPEMARELKRLRQEVAALQKKIK
jgi:hypothetical protein